MERGIWEERLRSSNQPLPERKITPEHPIYGLPRQYIADSQVLAPWTLWGLAEPIPWELLPLPEHHEAAHLVRSAGVVVRVGLVNYEEGAVVAWRLTHGSTAYQPRPSRRPAPP